jgi:hypothetical protein
VGLGQGPLSLVSIIEELLERKVAAPVYKTENTAVRILHADRVAPSPQKLALTSPTSGGRSVGIVRSRTQTTEFVLFVCLFSQSNGLLLEWRAFWNILCATRVIFSFAFGDCW